MPITTLPTKTAGDIGEALTDTRAPVDNELSATDYEKLKDRVIEIFTEVGLTDGSTPNSVWEAVLAGGGSGDVTGPASSTDNAIARFHLATGKVIQDSAVTIDDSGNISTSGTVDGRDLSVDGAKLDGIESGADVTDATNVAAAGAVMTSRTISTTSPLTGGGDLSANRTLAIPAATAAVDGYATAAQITKLDGIEALADVTDATNVAAAGAVMDTDFAGTHVGRLRRNVGSPAGYDVIRDGYSSSTPGATDDAADGYELGSLWLDTMQNRIFICTDPTTSAARWERLGVLAPVVDSGTSITLSDADHKKTIRCTAATTVSVSVPSGLQPGTTVELVQEGDGQVQLAGTGSPALTLRYPATFDPHTNEKYSTLVVTILDSDEAIVRGDMAAA